MAGAAPGPTAACSRLAPLSARPAAGRRTVWVRKPAMPGYASAVRVAFRPGGPFSVIVTRRPPRRRWVTLTRVASNTVLLIFAPASASAKSGLGLVHRRLG